MASSPFPSPVELSVASALLLLHTKPPCVSLSPRPPEFDFHGSALRESSGSEDKSKSSCGSEETSDSLSLSSVSKLSKSCASSLTSDGYSREIQAQKLRAIAVVARCPGMNLKVARKSRSKVFWSSDDQELAVEKPSATMSAGTVSSEASCLSSSSSAVSSARSRRWVARGEKRHAPLMKVHEEVKKRHAGSVSSGSTSLLRSRAEDILKLLSRGCSSEVKIRQALGDSPDTSKALRIRSIDQLHLHLHTINLLLDTLKVVKEGRSQKIRDRRAFQSLPLHDSLKI